MRSVSPTNYNGTIYCSDSNLFTAGVPNSRAWCSISNGPTPNRAHIFWFRVPDSTSLNLAITNICVSTFGGTNNYSHELQLCGADGTLSNTSVGSANHELIRSWNLKQDNILIPFNDGLLINKIPSSNASIYWFQISTSASDSNSTVDLSVSYTFF
jgi:hypothetical protein